MMNHIMKSGLTHPVMLGALLGILIGGGYLVFNAHLLEEENVDVTVNIAQHDPWSEQKRQLDRPRKIVTTSVKQEEVTEKTNQNAVMPLAAEIPKMEAVPPRSEPMGTSEKVNKDIRGQHYTLQLLGARKEENVKHFIAHHGLDKKAEIVRTKRQGQDWYIVLYGDYPSLQEAKSAALAVPSSLKQEGIAPWVRQRQIAIPQSTS